MDVSEDGSSVGGNNVCISKAGSRPRETSVYAVGATSGRRKYMEWPGVIRAQVSFNHDMMIVRRGPRRRRQLHAKGTPCTLPHIPKPRVHLDCYPLATDTVWPPAAGPARPDESQSQSQPQPSLSPARRTLICRREPSQRAKLCHPHAVRLRGSRKTRQQGCPLGQRPSLSGACTP